MNRIGLWIMLVALTGVGCLPKSVVREDQKPPAVRMQEQSPAPAPVSPDGITPENAAEKARKLRGEMEHETKRNMAAPRPASTKGEGE